MAPTLADHVFVPGRDHDPSESLFVSFVCRSWHFRALGRGQGGVELAFARYLFFSLLSLLTRGEIRVFSRHLPPQSLSCEKTHVDR